MGVGLLTGKVIYIFCSGLNGKAACPTHVGHRARVRVRVPYTHAAAACAGMSGVALKGCPSWVAEISQQAGPLLPPWKELPRVLGTWNS